MRCFKVNEVCISLFLCVARLSLSESQFDSMRANDAIPLQDELCYLWDSKQHLMEHRVHAQWEKRS